MDSRQEDKVGEGCEAIGDLMHGRADQSARQGELMIIVEDFLRRL